MGERDQLSRRIAVSLAVVVVLGAGLAVLQRRASINESNYARETTRVAVKAMGANVEVEAFLGTDAGVRAESELLRFRPPLNARSTEEAPRDLDVAVAPATLDRLRFTAERATLAQRALATTRIAWNTRSTQYTTVIAVLAAALFLVGFGLVVEGGLRRATALSGLAVACFAAGWALWLHQQPIPRTPSRAVDLAARGAVLTAGSDYRAAVAAYDGALAADDGYAAAYLGRARARLLAANPDYLVTGAYTDTSGAASAAGVRDAERALDLEGRRDVLGLRLVALGAFSRGDHRKALGAVDEALTLKGDIPELLSLKSAVQAALGDEAAAERSRERALRPLGGTDPSQRLRLLTSSYLSSLGQLAATDPARAASTRRLAARAVASETSLTLGRPLPRRLPRSGEARVDGLRVADGRLALRLSWRDLPRGTALTALAYERPRPGAAWTQPADLAVFADVGGAGQRGISVPVRRACRPTAVRVDVFLDGAPALSQAARGGTPTC